ncbi:exported hypothetical protein [Verrucomicrobia bacterium]|nr:exported hypothetical protein [Verrucomicrobiota bacterium]
MKKAFFVICAISLFAWTGCNKGGAGDQYNSGTGNSGYSMSNAPSTSPNTGTSSNTSTTP